MTFYIREYYYKLKVRSQNSFYQGKEWQKKTGDETISTVIDLPCLASGRRPSAGDSNES